MSPVSAKLDIFLHNHQHIITGEIQLLAPSVPLFEQLVQLGSLYRIHCFSNIVPCQCWLEKLFASHPKLPVPSMQPTHLIRASEKLSTSLNNRLEHVTQRTPSRVLKINTQQGITHYNTVSRTPSR
jgi:hypothetical protein